MLGGWEAGMFKVSVRNRLEQDLQWSLAATEPGQNQVCFLFFSRQFSHSVTPKIHSGQDLQNNTFQKEMFLLSEKITYFESAPAEVPLAFLHEQLLAVITLCQLMGR